MFKDIQFSVPQNLKDLAETTVAYQLAAVQQLSQLAWQDSLLGLEMSWPPRAFPALSRAFSRHLHTQVSLGVSGSELAAKMLDAGVEAAEQLPLAKEALGPVPEQLKQHIRNFEANLCNIGRTAAGKAFAF